METEKKQRGGARAGAGRKKIGNGRTQTFTFKLSDKASEILEKKSLELNTSKNDVINKLLENLS